MGFSPTGEWREANQKMHGESRTGSTKTLLQVRMLLLPSYVTLDKSHKLSGHCFPINKPGVMILTSGML